MLNHEKVSFGDLENIRDRLSRIELMQQTLLRVLIEKGVLDKQEFSQWMKYVDQLDGRDDGKMAEESGVKSCPSCGRNNPVKLRNCQYCGADLPFDFLMHQQK